MMKQKLDTVTVWFYANKFSLNLSKRITFYCALIKKSHICNKPIGHLIGISIPRVTSVKFFSTHLDQCLAWSNHYYTHLSQVIKKVGIMARITHQSPSLSLYYSLRFLILQSRLLIYPLLRLHSLILHSTHD